MARKNLTPKRHLGQEIPASTIDMAKRLSQALCEAAATPQLVAAAMGAAPAEASEIEKMAVRIGAEILFDANKEGPITSLAIILIPDENRQNRRVAALAADFGFVANLSKRKRIAVAAPAGYVTDFASIPGFAQWIISPFGKHSEAAVVHDWLYTLGTPGDEKGRKLADRTFKRALYLVGVDWLRRNIMYLAVRLGGKSGYGLESDYDFRELDRLKPRMPKPDRKALMVTFKEADIPKPVKAARKSKAEAKVAAQDTMVAVETKAP